MSQDLWEALQIVLLGKLEVSLQGTLCLGVYSTQATVNNSISLGSVAALGSNPLP